MHSFTDAGAAPLVAPPSTALRHRATMVVFTATSLLGSALLFLVQPLIARMLLPRAGGSASLWNTAMVFFQVTLLVGYLFAHLTIGRLGVCRHRFLQMGLLLVPLAVLPLAVPDGWSLDADNPVPATLAILAMVVGAPFFALSTASPTLQRWFAATDHPNAADPYFLYAAGNVGSIGALLGYPLVIEPRLGLTQQAELFGSLYLALIALTAVSALLVKGASRSVATTPSVSATGAARPIDWSRRVRWVGLAAVPSALLLGVTRHLATDVASFPLLWVVPLTLYLLTFVVAFGTAPERLLGPTGKVVRIGAIAVALSFVGQALVSQLLIHLGWFFAAALLGHLLLAADRPEAGRLTEFYAWISLGGALGGTFAALVAPLVFDRLWEYPIAIVAAVLLARPDRTGSGARVAVVAGIVVAGLVVAGGFLRHGDELRLAGLALGAAGMIAYATFRRPAAMAAAVGGVMAALVLSASTGVIHRDRSFFGAYEVRETSDGWHQLVMGTTMHGQQRAEAPTTPTSYYHPSGPLGDVFGVAGRAPVRAGIVGLGAGEIAAYGRAGDAFTFYEIDPVVVDIATDPALFTYLADTDATVAIEVGDGRIAIEEGAVSFDVLAIDAFSSDAIPVHLLTVEAVRSYLDHLDDDGLLLLHISNRHFDLAPVLGRLAQEEGLVGTIRNYAPDETATATAAKISRWVALSPSPAAAALGDEWVPLPVGGELWTDDYSDLLSTLVL